MPASLIGVRPMRPVSFGQIVPSNSLTSIAALGWSVASFLARYHTTTCVPSTFFQSSRIEQFDSQARQFGFPEVAATPITATPVTGAAPEFCWCHQLPS